LQGLRQEDLLNLRANKEQEVMHWRAIVGWLSVALLVLASAFVAYGIWFCAGALHGDFQGCLSSAGSTAMASPIVSVAFIVAVAGLILAGARWRR
jgi:hypothetical protein